jgi:RNA polymerase sigma factor (sigma-70 family)
MLANRGRVGLITSLLPMSSDCTRSSGRIHSAGCFEETLWSRVLAAGRGNHPGSNPALEELCRRYWPPIYAFLRRSGHPADEARDLTQGFFAYLIERDLIGKIVPDRGRFRSFLLGVLKNYVANERAREDALKRGGGHKAFSIDEQTAEGLYLHEPAHDITPEKMFERRWALSVLEQAMERLSAEYGRAGMAPVFELLKPWLTGEQDASYAELGASLEKSEAAARVLVCRLRNRFRQVIRAVIADTVQDLEQVELELKHLQAALRRP